MSQETIEQKAARLGAPLPKTETANSVLAKPIVNRALGGEDAAEDSKTPWLSVIHAVGDNRKKFPQDIGKFLLKGEIVLGAKLNVVFCTINRYWSEILPPPYDPNKQGRKYMTLAEAQKDGLSNDYVYGEAYVGRAADCVMAIEIPDDVNDANIDFQINLDGKDYTIVKFGAKKKAFMNGVSPAITRYRSEQADPKNKRQLHDYTWLMEIRDIVQKNNPVPTPFIQNPTLHSPEMSTQLATILNLNGNVETPNAGE